MTVMPKWPFEEIPDPAGLSDADWAELNKLKAAYESGGAKALSAAFRELVVDPIRYISVVGALFPDMVREQIKDTLAARGLTEEDIRRMLEEIKRQSESPSRESH